MSVNLSHAWFLQKNSLVVSNRKMQLRASELSVLIAEVVATLGLPSGADYFLSLAVAEGTDPEPLTALEQLKAKAKVQIWDYNPSISAYSAADEEATSEATEEAADATEAAAAAEQEKQQAVANEEKLAAARQAADVMIRYEKEAAEAVSLSDTGEMQVSVVSGHIL